MMRVAPTCTRLIAAAILFATACGGEAEVELSVVWADGAPVTEVPLRVQTHVDAVPLDGPTRRLVEGTSVLYEPGVAVSVPGVPHGRRRVVAVDIMRATGDEDEEEPLLFHGETQPFSLRAGGRIALRLTMASTAPWMERDGLLLAYDRTLADSSRIIDVGLAGTPLDMMVGSPSAVVALPDGGFEALGDTLIATDVNESLAENEVSVAGWFSATNAVQTAPLISYGTAGEPERLALWQQDTEVVGRVALASGPVQPVEVASVAVTPGQWQHWALTYDGEVVRLFVDGDLVARVDDASGLAAASGAERLSLASSADAGVTWRGAIRLVTVHGRAMTQSEIVRAVEQGPR